MSFGTSFLPTKYAGEGQSMNPQYEYTRSDDENLQSLDLLCNRPPPESDDEKWALFGAAIFGGKCSIEDFWFVVHTVMDFLFIIDVVFSFRLAFPLHDDPIQVLSRHGDQFETSGKVIAKEYIKFWFWPDILSGVPMDIITWGMASSGSGGQGAEMARVLKTLKLFKIMRIWRLRKLRALSATSETDASRRRLRLLMMLGIYGILSHWGACGLAYISDPSISPLADIDKEYGRVYNGESWLENLGISTVHPLQKYVRAFLW